MGELHVMAARVKTEKSKRRPVKSAHVAVDVKPVAPCMLQRLDQKKRRAVALGLSPCYQRQPSSSHLFPPRLSRLRRPDAARGVDLITGLLLLCVEQINDDDEDDCFSDCPPDKPRKRPGILHWSGKLWFACSVLPQLQ